MKNKKCNSCDTVKPITEFYKNQSSKIGLNYECKACTKLRNASVKHELEKVDLMVHKFIMGNFT